MVIRFSSLKALKRGERSFGFKQQDFDFLSIIYICIDMQILQENNCMYMQVFRFALRMAEQEPEVR
jgi:hypothetical protein